ncbi:hypothetical protein MON38_01405 [Hymenobacter sp. DH14]|uniref:Uncharacterized protein n=1 Tax=Hymenobacter cyanobacteriorum TaxID=2926463 RepID=A0A9X1VC97_9BACT|nr:hypothetical protein [Hymenobacter cyanobacteriorum]MCI1186057.1 hypothetical protein [Hymenobacter cyanobacteriorum]
MRATTKRQLITIAILAGLNILMGNLVAGNGQQLSGETVAAHSPEMRKAVLTTFLVSIQFFSFILGALAALVPYRQQQYSEKWLTFSLWIAVGLQSFSLVASVIKLLFW